MQQDGERAVGMAMAAAAAAMGGGGGGTSTVDSREGGKGARAKVNPNS